MSGSEMLATLRENLNKKNVHELWQIAREIGVSSPTGGKTKARVIDELISIASCKTAPTPRSARGAPPKSDSYDEEIVKDIRLCMSYFAAVKEGTGEGRETELSDGTQEVGCAGILDSGENYRFLRVKGCFPSADDVFVAESLVTRFKLKDGDYIEGTCRRGGKEAAGLTAITRINGSNPLSVLRREFEDLTPIYPKNRIRIGISPNDIFARMADLFAPVGLGQRAVISVPANCSTAIIKQITHAISLNKSVRAVILLVAARPEEVTDIKRSVETVETYHTTFDMDGEAHVKAADFVVRHLKNSVESGEDVVLIVDGLSKLSDAAKRILSSAICAEEGGSLTVIATVSAEGEYSSEYSAELLSVANMRIVLSKELAAENVAAIDISQSYTLNCELLQSDSELKTAYVLRKQYKTGGNLREIVRLFKETENNAEIINSNG